MRYLAIVFLLTCICSCRRDYLDTPPALVVVRQQYVRDLASCQDVLNGIYAVLARDFYDGLHHNIYPDLIADNVKPYPGSVVYSFQYSWAQLANEDNSLTPGESSRNINSLYVSGYEVIRNCSYLLENIDRFRNEDPEKADNMKGQCLGLRALVHHDLVKAFAQPYFFSYNGAHPGIAYVTTWDYKRPVSRISVAEVYANIINDLEAALPLLSGTSSNKNAVSELFVKAALSRVHLYKGDYLSAKNMARLVISEVPLMSTDHYPSKLYTLEDGEALLQLAPSQVSSANTYFSGYYYRMQPHPLFLASEDIASLLNENVNDKRGNWIKKTDNGWRITKFPVNKAVGIADSTRSYYDDVIRSSEMYLNAAEAYAQLGMQDSARFYLDAIRQRADPAQPAVTATGDALLDSIYKERRKEFAFEGHRMYDLLRIGRGVDRIDAPVPAASSLPYPSDKAVAPIPRLDVSLSGIPQNSGY